MAKNTNTGVLWQKTYRCNAEGLVEATKTAVEDYLQLANRLVEDKPSGIRGVFSTGRPYRMDVSISAMSEDGVAVYTVVMTVSK